MKKKELIGYLYSYTDQGDTCDGYPCISKVYRDEKIARREMKKDAKEYRVNFANCCEVDVKYVTMVDKKNAIDLLYNDDFICLYRLHPVFK